jgi:hypothetical protein
MSRDIELRLQIYANLLVDNHLQREYNNQLSKWKVHVNRVGVAYSTAVKRHEAAKTTAKARAESRAELTMAALTFVTGIALSWVGGYLQYALSPRFFNMTPRYTASRLWGKNWVDSFESSTSHELVHIFGHVFGELPEQLKEFGADVIIKPQAREESDGQSLASLLGRPNAETFRMTLETAIEKEFQKTSKSIGSVALGILTAQDYGQACLKRLRKLNPSSVHASGDRLEALAKKMIVDDIDRQRREFAKKWFYFGNDPIVENLDDMSDKIETEIWATWIIDQGFGDPVYTPGYGQDDDVEFDGIVERLVDLDIAAAHSDNQRTQQKERLASHKGRVIPVAPYEEAESGSDSRAIYDEIATFALWAQNHNPDPIGGASGGKPRDIGSILDVYK